jgi:hypothetical protein
LQVLIGRPGIFFDLAVLGFLRAVVELDLAELLEELDVARDVRVAFATIRAVLVIERSGNDAVEDRDRFFNLSRMGMP